MLIDEGEFSPRSFATNPFSQVVYVLHYLCYNTYDSMNTHVQRDDCHQPSETGAFQKYIIYHCVPPLLFFCEDAQVSHAFCFFGSATLDPRCGCGVCLAHYGFGFIITRSRDGDSSVLCVMCYYAAAGAGCCASANARSPQLQCTIMQLQLPK